MKRYAFLVLALATMIGSTGCCNGLLPWGCHRGYQGGGNTFFQGGGGCGTGGCGVQGQGPVSFNGVPRSAQFGTPLVGQHTALSPTPMHPQVAGAQLDIMQPY